MDVPRFAKELPAMIRFRNEHPDQTVFSAFDQAWLNLYFKKQPNGRHMLPLYWNWTLYWQLEPVSSWSDVKIVHFHGPKPDSGAWYMADCRYRNLTHIHPVYHSLIHDSICCDGGKTAARVRALYERVAPAPRDIGG